MKESCAFSTADIILPKSITEKWPVIACDQYTSEPEYWESVKEFTKGEESTLNFILPECYLGDDNTEKIKEINRNMQSFINGDSFNVYRDALIYIERTQSDGRVRRGIVGKIDLSAYDYMPGSSAEIRATEKTVVSRIPPRVNIRKDAPLELPHAMLLIDDCADSVIGVLSVKKEQFKKLYDIDIMKNGGHICGYLLDEVSINEVLNALVDLKKKNNGFLFCVGDGNHSLAAAKECYNLCGNEKSRYALTEIVNIHDSSLSFEPIYRVVFDVDFDKIVKDFVDFCGGEYSGSDAQAFKVISANKEINLKLKPKSKLPVGTLQAFLDTYSSNIDYIHGEEALRKICKKENGVGFLFNGMGKEELFPAVSEDGSLPRKTFSMGHADDKRFYLEARVIK